MQQLKQQQNQQHLHLQAMDGVRTMTCFLIVLIHVHYFLGTFFFLSSHDEYAFLNSIPVFRLSFHMTLFWFLSGFLCTLQLDRMGTRKRYGKFLFNRLLRLYPLYAGMCFIIYSSRDLGVNRMGITKCDQSQLWQSLLFVMTFPESPTCAGPGWSVMVDVHGYLVIVLTFIFVPSYYRKAILGTLYVMSMMLLLSTTSKEDLVIDMKAPYGLETLQDFELASLDGLDYDVRDLYNDVDFEDEKLVVVRNIRRKALTQMYFTSVFKHGSATLLGSLLYWNLKEKKQPRYYYNWIKIACASFLMYITSGFYGTSGLPVYLVMEVILRTKSKLLGNKFWTTMAPYTYGIYLVHPLVLVGAIVPPVFQARIQAMDSGDEVHYRVGTVVGIAVLVFVVSLGVSWILHHTIEWPFHYIRKRYLRTTTKTCVNQGSVIDETKKQKEM